MTSLPGQTDAGAGLASMRERGLTLTAGCLPGECWASSESGCCFQALSSEGREAAHLSPTEEPGMEASAGKSQAGPGEGSPAWQAHRLMLVFCLSLSLSLSVCLIHTHTHTHTL